MNLVARNANIHVTPLHSAAAGSHAEIVKLLLEHGGDPNAAQDGGFTPLHSAAQNDDRESVEALLEAGADPSLANDDGQPAAVVATKGLLLRHTGAAIVAVTLDVDGSVVLTQDGAPVRTQARPSRHSHASGAGDAYLAGFVLARVAGAELAQAARVAQECATRAIRHTGTAVCPALAGLAPPLAYQHASHGS